MDEPRARPEASVCGVVLAAGLSRRFAEDRPKQLVPFDGEPLVRRIARRALASHLAEVIVVVGHEAQAVRQALSGLALRVVDNPDYFRGQSTSVKAGLQALAPDTAAALFLPVDQPYVTTVLMDRLIGLFATTGGPVVRPSFRGRGGSPVLFSRRFFPELQAITGDEGGRQVLRRYPEAIVHLEIETEAPLRDLNTLQDYEDLGGWC